MATPITVPMVGKIVSVSVKVGDKVKEDDQVAVMEAMKMEMPLVAPVSGVVKEICVSAGQEVEADPTPSNFLSNLHFYHPTFGIQLTLLLY